jgi:hypothetical protein
MTAASVMPITAVFPALQTMQDQRRAEAAPPVDAALVGLCVRLRKDQQARRCCEQLRPQDWESFSHDSAALRATIRLIADTRATSRIGLRAKALALHALLDEGGGELYEDAAAPDVLAWSLLQDILSE